MLPQDAVRRQEPRFYVFLIFILDVDWGWGLGAQNVLLALRSGISPNGAHETIWGARDLTGL